MNKETLPYRPGVGALVFNRRGEVLVARRNDIASEAWQLPQGGVDPGEDIRHAVLREVEEELGTAKLEVLAESHDWHTYDLPDELIGKAFKGRYRGQRQRWYALLFTGSDAEIDCVGVTSPEFAAWKWAAIDELPGMAVSFKRRVYESLVAEFRPLADRLAGGQLG